MDPRIKIGIAAVALAAIVLMPRLRRAVLGLIGCCIAVVSIVAAVGAGALLMNNVPINDDPGAEARVWRFLTVDWAATSEKGTGSAQCAHGWPGAQPGAGLGKSEANAPEGETSVGGRHKREHRAARKVASPEPPRPTPAQSAPPEDDYPELVRRGYPGISSGRLFGLAKETVGTLGGWRIANTDSRSYTIDCVYTTRVFRFEDDVRIVAMPNSEIDVCSRSQVGEPGSGSLLGWFPGDLGANIGHIKEFYEALQPRVDAVYKEQERRMNEGK